jgi:hypothetical protein
MKAALLLVLAGCVSFPAVKPTPRGTLLEIANVPEGLNCYPVRGHLHERGSMCTWRLRTTLDDVLGKMLDRHLPPGYQARFELESARFVTGPDTPTRIVERDIAYHFTLTRDGKTALDVHETYMEPVLFPFRPIPAAMVEAPDLYDPPMLYQLVFHLLDHLADQIDASGLNG